MRSVHTKHFFARLGDRLVVMAEHAHAFRQMEVLEEVSHLLVSGLLPRQYEPIGRYYQAVCIQRFGRGDVERAEGLLERVAANAPLRYRARAMISLAANLRHKCDNESALTLYCEAARFASRNNISDAYAALGTHKMVAVINSENENHRGALSLLENLFPLAQMMRWAQPHLYYDYLNSFAVELCEVGRLEEARNASQIVLASPFAPAYPEWHETRAEIELRGRRASRSTVGFSQSVADTVEAIGNEGSSEAQKPSSVPAEFAADSLDVSPGPAEASNILRFPVREQAVGSSLAASSRDTQEPARVLIMSERNNAVGGDSNETPQAKKRYGDLDGRQLLLKIMELTAAKDITDYELLEILGSIESILFRQKGPGKR
ncbi:MAG: hypothetical protein WAU45_05320 [Blastocatellia bacterium]